MALYQDPVDKLCIRFDQLILGDRPETQVPWTWQFGPEKEPYVRPGTPCVPSSEKDKDKLLALKLRENPELLAKLVAELGLPPLPSKGSKIPRPRRQQG